MRILYIARHNEGDNDPEGAIAHALRVLGHEVLCIRERGVRYSIETSSIARNAHLCLFHKWDSQSELRYIKQELGIPCIFWHFDLIDAKDPTVAQRSRLRIEWMNRIVPHVDLGFCTDGDWVEKWNNVTPIDSTESLPYSSKYTNKLYHLMQGADERVTGPGVVPPNSLPGPDILFTGTPERNGIARTRWIQWMKDTYGDRFRIVGPDQRRGRVVQRNLANLIATSKIVIAPDGPQTHCYWSNRIYLTLGFQGFLLHPYCLKLAQEHYTHDREVVYYMNRNSGKLRSDNYENLRSKIDYTLENPQYRAEVAMAGYERTIREHLYRHRLETMLSIVKERRIAVS